MIALSIAVVLLLVANIVLMMAIIKLQKLRKTWVIESNRLIQLQENLAQNMSHELRTPITAMKGYTDLLHEWAQADHLDSRYIDALDTIARNQNFLLDLLNSILNYAKFSSDGKFIDQKPQATSVRIFAEEIVELFKVQAQKRGLYLTLEIDKASPDMVNVRSGALRLIFINLLQNALKFTKHGGVAIKVGYQDSQEENRGTLAITVSDTGIGIEEVDLNRIFQPFFQASSSASREFGGVGLGLAISKNLTRHLNGNLIVESTVGKGSSFKLTVPVERTVEMPTKLTPPEEKKLSSINLTNKKKILLVEDSTDSMLLLKHLLAKLEIEVVTAQNGREAVDVVLRAAHNSHPVDLILMDMQMPVMNGFQATRLLRQRGYDKPIIAITAHNLAGDREKCIAAGCSDYVAKPIDLPIFYSKLHSVGV